MYKGGPKACSPLHSQKLSIMIGWGYFWLIVSGDKIWHRSTSMSMMYISL